jgi:glyoxylase-like metal-dependent hydrolase (beta-lactamase superfamily II)
VVPIFEQLFDPASSTYTYLIGDAEARVCALVDPVREQINRDLARVDELGLKLIYTIETHIHADHVTAGNALAQRRGCRPVIHADSNVQCESVPVRGGDVVKVGAVELRVIETPGHTPESVSYLFDGKVLTGDALLVHTCGRTDFQGGDAGTLWDSVHERLYTLPDETRVFPAHDYKGNLSSTIGEEKRENARLNRSRDEFIALMDSLGLPRPKLIDEALPANLRCGRPPDPHAA